MLAIVCSCNTNVDKKMLNYAFRIAGENRQELEAVIDHYKDDSLKLKAAKFLIMNMPGHYSYLSDDINDYYETAYNLFLSDLSPSKQHDSLLYLSEHRYSGIDNKRIQDARIITSEFLIKNIDQSFNVWQNERWAKHLNFEEFCEWILPYKCTELQKFDNWRDTMSSKFSYDLKNMDYDDECYDSPFRAVNVVRGEILRKIKPFGIYIKSGYPMLSAETISNMTYGLCVDYVNLGVLTFRSLGIPVIKEETPSWGRYRAGHSWYTLLNDHGEEMQSEWDISSCPGSPFFPYQRIPKVYRCTYAINKERIDYQNNSTYQYPFGLFKLDITDRYFKTSDIVIPIRKGLKLNERFAYIATFNGHSSEWTIVDYGNVKKDKAYFNKMGRNILYVAMGYDGTKLIPINNPFIIHKDGSLEFIKYDYYKKRSIDVRRKYYSSENVVAMRKRILGGKIQASNYSDFRNAETLFTIDSLNIPDKIAIKCDKPYRYWRYLSSDGTYGSLAELAFFDKDTVLIKGRPISNDEVEKDNLLKAYDDNWLSYFESSNLDGVWIGMDFDKQRSVRYVRIVPRSDDNDIRAGDEYELKYWDGRYWVTLDIREATDNILHYDNVPDGSLLWIHDITRGWDERVFLMRGNEVEWW